MPYQQGKMTMRIDRRWFLAGAGAATFAARTAAAKGAADPVPVNPLVRQRADAQVFRHDDGWYYMTGSVPEYDRLVLRRARTLAGLAAAAERVVWRHPASGPMAGFLWAPELHRIGRQWILYFAAGPSGGGEDPFRIRTYALACDDADPMAGAWRVLGRFQAPWDSFNLDSTSFVHRGTRYFAWAQQEPGIDTNSNLYLAPMATPLTLAAAPVRLSVPTLDWEVQGYKVNEAPALLVRGGRLFLTYSASATDSRYCLGMLSVAEDADLMNPANWRKAQDPVFVSAAETRVFGPGHNSFTVDEAGRDVLVYHGREYREIQGDPLFDPNRHTRVQRIYYREDGTPDFGIPVGNGAVPDRFSPVAAPDRFLLHAGDAVRVGTGPLPASQFRAVPAADGPGILLAPIAAPDRAIAVPAEGAAHLVPLAGAGGTAPTRFLRHEAGGGEVRFAAIGTGRWLVHRAGTVRLGRADGSERFRVS